MDHLPHIKQLSGWGAVVLLLVVGLMLLLCR